MSVLDQHFDIAKHVGGNQVIDTANITKLSSTYTDPETGTYTLEFYCNEDIDIPYVKITPPGSRSYLVKFSDIKVTQLNQIPVVPDTNQDPYGHKFTQKEETIENHRDLQVIQNLTDNDYK